MKREVLFFALLLGFILVVVASLNVAARGKVKVDSSPRKEGVDWERYAGRWYEVVRKPHIFEKGMHHVVATYTLRPDGVVEVTNEGYKNGKYKRATAKARTTEQPSQLMVTFFLFPAEYNILEVGEDYEYAVVGGKGANYLWILSRTPTMDEDVLAGIYERLLARGYTLDDLIMVEQQ